MELQSLTEIVMDDAGSGQSNFSDLIVLRRSWNIVNEECISSYTPALLRVYTGGRRNRLPETCCQEMTQ